MLWKRSSSQGAAETLDGCSSAQGPRTYVRIEGPTLRYTDLTRVITQLRASGAKDGGRDAVFDFSSVEEIEPPWTPVFAVIADFARQVPGDCVMTGLHGRTAAMAELAFGGRWLGRVEVVEQPQAAQHPFFG